MKQALTDAKDKADILNQLEKYMKSRSIRNGISLQKEMNDNYEQNIETNGQVWDVTLQALETIAKIYQKAEKKDKKPLKSDVSFSNDKERGILLNVKDSTGKIVQRLSSADLMGTAKDTMSPARKEEFNKLILLSTVADIWIQAASKDMDSLLLGSFRESQKKQYQDAINKVTKLISDMGEKFKKGESISWDILSIYNPLTGPNETVGISPSININSMRSAIDIVRTGTGTLEERRAKILKMLSSKFDGGTTEAVKSIAMTDVMDMDGMKDIKKKLSNPTFMNEFTSGDSKTWIPKLTQGLGISESKAYELARELRDTRKGISERDEEIRTALTAKGATTQIINDRMQWAKNVSLSLVMARYMTDAKIDTLSWPMVEVYRQAKSDMSWNRAIDIGVQVAISLVPMGVGVLAARWALAVGRGIMATRAGAMVPGRLTGTAGRFAAWAAVEGVGFYQGFNLTNNLIREQDTDASAGDYFKWVWDMKEMVKSVAMIGVIRGLPIPMLGNRIDMTKFAKDGNLLQRTNATILSSPKIAEALKIAGVSAAVVGTSQGVEALFGEWFNPTPEEYAQAVIMTALFRGRFGGGKQKESLGKIPTGYELIEITSRKWINVVRIKQKTDPAYKPEIVGQKWEIYLVESIQGSSWREMINLKNKATGDASSISSKDLTSGQYKTLSPVTPETIVTTSVSKTSSSPNLISTPSLSSTLKIGSKISKTPTEILDGIKAAKMSNGNKIILDEMKVAIENVNTMSQKQLIEARWKINDIGSENIIAGKIKKWSSLEKAQAELMTRLDEMITLKTPKFTSLEAATKWIKENPKTTIGTVVAIAAAGGLAYYTVNKDGTVTPNSTGSASTLDSTPAPATGSASTLDSTPAATTL